MERAGVPQFDLTGKYTGSTQIGNSTCSGTVNLAGDMKNSSEIGPYGGIGFGRTTTRGFGVTLDLGVGYLGEGKISFSPVLNSECCSLSARVRRRQSELVN